MADTGSEWTTISTGIGEEWDFERDGPMIGFFLGSTSVETRKTESGVATAYQFAPVGQPDEIVFVWESSELARAFASDMVRTGDKVRIRFLGREQFTGEDGKPRQVKRYRVDVASAPSK